ncbi:hypothetical protein D1BOALGB6SA_9430 [Olavius sp. associated proteobacterium Delta 1]|nr:hypothetical protein D1BOALGB6SA_9430 [Olavius sp. associated proteobacterium Delta 1]
MTTTKLGASIQECLSNEQIKQKAEETAGIIKQQDSIELTVTAVLKSIIF